MSTDLNKLKLNDLIYLAQHVNYVKPEKNYNNWTEDEILFDAINIGLNNKSQIDIIFSSCDLFPPIKMLIKERIKRYIKQFIN